MNQASIIIVEDEIIVAKSIQQTLEGLGYAVPELATSGEEAISKISQNSPDLVLMDIVLPGDMDGIETARHIDRHYGIPIVFVTGHHDQATVNRANETNPVGYVLKPFTNQELHAAVKSALTHTPRRPKPLVKKTNNRPRAKLPTTEPAPGLLPTSKDHYSLVEDLPALVCSFLNDGTLTYVNTAYCQYFNKSKESLIDSNFLWNIPKTGRKLAQMQFQSLTPDSPVASHEHQVLAPNGQTRWQQWTYRAFFDDQFNIINYQAVGYDCTERKLVEADLLLSDQILQQMPHAVIVTNLNGVIQRWTGKAEAVLGYSAHEAIGQSIRFLSVPQLNHDPAQDIIDQTRETGEFLGEITCVTKDGKNIPIEISAKPIFDKFGKPMALLGILKDVAARKKGEHALAESEERFRLAFENANIGVWLIDMDGKLLRVNHRMCEILGYTAAELEQLNVNDISHPQDIDVSLDFIQRSLEGQLDHIDFEKRYLHKQGHIIWANTSTSLVRDPNGEPLYFISHVQDITRSKTIETEREKLIKQLETKNAELERMTYTISHDLKSPLITIQGFLTLLERDAANNDSDRLAQDIKFIRTAAKKMKQLVDDLLELSRIGRLTSPQEIIPLSDLVREAVSVVAGSINVRGAKVHVSANMPTVVGDRARLLQVFQNLIDNAVKFMGDEPNPTLKIGGRVEGGFAVCYVKDNGIGIDARYHHRIFNLFDRLDTETEGSGVGLALAKRVMEVHNGQIWVESAGDGLGSTFWLKLPLNVNETKP